MLSDKVVKLTEAFYEAREALSAAIIEETNGKVVLGIGGEDVQFVALHETPETVYYMNELVGPLKFFRMYADNTTFKFHVGNVPCMVLLDTSKLGGAEDDVCLNAQACGSNETAGDL